MRRLIILISFMFFVVVVNYYFIVGVLEKLSEIEAESLRRSSNYSSLQTQNQLLHLKFLKAKVEAVSNELKNNKEKLDHVLLLKRRARSENDKKALAILEKELSEKVRSLSKKSTMLKMRTYEFSKHIHKR